MGCPEGHSIFLLCQENYSPFMRLVSNFNTRTQWWLAPRRQTPLKEVGPLQPHACASSPTVHQDLNQQTQRCLSMAATPALFQLWGPLYYALQFLPLVFCYSWRQVVPAHTLIPGLVFLGPIVYASAALAPWNNQLLASSSASDFLPVFLVFLPLSLCWPSQVRRMASQETFCLTLRCLWVWFKGISSGHLRIGRPNLGFLPK